MPFSVDIDSFGNCTEPAFLFDIMVNTSAGRTVIDIIPSQGGVDEAAVLRRFAKAYDVNPSKMILVVHPRPRDTARSLPPSTDRGYRG